MNIFSYHSNQLAHLKKKVAEFVLNKFKDYIDFDAKQVLLTKDGAVEIANVLIKKDACKGLAQPIELLHGCIGKIRIKISWFDIGKNENDVVEIEDVYAVLR